MGRGGGETHQVQQRAAAHRHDVGMPVDVVAINLGLDFGNMKVGVLHPLSTFENERRANQTKCVRAALEPGFDLRRQSRLGEMQRFVEDQ